jgi:hypothetical protein
VRDPVDAKVRRALGDAGIAYSVVGGSGEARVQAALACVARFFAPPSVTADTVRWHWHCERCGDANCERHPAPRLPR